MKKPIRQFVSENIHSIIFLLVVLFILIVGLIARYFVRSHMREPDLVDIGDTLGRINPTILVNGEYYEWRNGNAILYRQFAEEEPDWEKEKGMIYYGKIKKCRHDLPRKDREFAADFKASGTIFLDPGFDDIVYLKIKTDWLEDKFVIFDRITEEEALNGGKTEYTEWDVKWFATMDYPMTQKSVYWDKTPESELKDILNPPKLFVHTASNQKMAKLLINYPLFDRSFDYSDDDCILDYLSDFNIYNELIRSDEGIECILDEYQCTIFDPETDLTEDFKLNVEIFGHQFIVNNMDSFSEANKTLCKAIIEKKEKIYANIEDDNIRSLLSFDND